MRTPTRPLVFGTLLFALGLAGCDAGTGPDRGQTRVLLSQGSAASASFSVGVAPDRDSNGGRAAIALVDSLDVTITAIQALPAQFVDSPERDQSWETLTLDAPITVDLFALPSSGDGLEIGRGDLAPGAYVRLRFLVSEASIRFRAPLTVGRNTFEADTALPLNIPTPWISVPGAYFTVAEGEGGVARVVFDASASLGHLVVGGNGRLTLTPVIRGRDSRGSDRDD